MTDNDGTSPLIANQTTNKGWDSYPLHG